MILVLLLCIILAFTLAMIATTRFVEQLKSNGSAKLGKGFQVNFSLVPIDNKKSEDDMQVSAPQKRNFD
jgi:hypothetical protein